MNNNEEKHFNILFNEEDSTQEGITYNFKYIKYDENKWYRYSYNESTLITWEDVPRRIHPRIWDFQSENKINKVEDILMEKEYLIWVNFGGENGSPNRLQDYYKICKGRTEEEAVKDWFKQNNFNIDDIDNFEGTWTHYGRNLTLVRLIKDNGYDNWKTLEWV